MHGGDLMFASAILLFGSNFKKISMFSKFLKYWVEHQDGILELFI
jgi:hypothetical protein